MKRPTVNQRLMDIYHDVALLLVVAGLVWVYCKIYVWLSR